MADSSTLAIDLLTGGLLGFLGQGVRVVVGLKKLHDEAAVAGSSASDAFSPSQLLVSLLIGTIAGVAAVFALSDFTSPLVLTRDTAIGIMGAGYAGADFIEGFAKRALPGGGPSGPGGTGPSPQTPSASPHPEPDAPPVG